MCGWSPGGRAWDSPCRPFPGALLTHSAQEVAQASLELTVPRGLLGLGPQGSSFQAVRMTSHDQSRLEVYTKPNHWLKVNGHFHNICLFREGADPMACTWNLAESGPLPSTTQTQPGHQARKQAPPPADTLPALNIFKTQKMLCSMYSFSGSFWRI